MSAPPLLTAEWSAPANVVAVATTRAGGCSAPPYDSFNLAFHVGDDPAAVAHNRQVLSQSLPDAASIQWLEQVHGTAVAIPLLQPPDPGSGRNELAEARADAVYLDRPGLAGAVLTADCLPVFFADAQGASAAVAHAGWRGLADGILERTLAAFPQEPADIHVWFGPAIGPCHFEVGDEVRSVFLDHATTPELRARLEYAFSIGEQDGKWMADLYMIARLRLKAAGIRHITGGQLCTACSPEKFYSYRREGTTGRMASLIYIKPA